MIFGPARGASGRAIMVSMTAVNIADWGDTMKKHLLLVSCALGALVLSSGGAYAATAAAAATATTSETNGTTIGELVVTAERRQENLQDTPIAVTAFSADTLQASKLNGGEDLLLKIPNANYSRTNFGGYNFKIRGIGTDVIGSGGTAGVSINVNELPVSAANFANADFFDVDRVEVLRGPQGTLYGRNATGGAVDIITTQPSSTFGGFGTVEYGNYNTVKVTGAVNIPLAEGLALRLAGTRLVQDGFGFNSFLNQRVDGRDLGSFRGTLSFKPNDRFSAYLLFEHFGEDDNRNRVGKQLCIKDTTGNTPFTVGGVPVAAAGGPIATNYAAFLNQGCVPGSLYQSSAYGTLNSNSTLGGLLANLTGLSNGKDLFGNHPLQNTNLHDIESAIQPLYTSQEDLVDLHMAYNLTDHLTLTSITGFNHSQGTTAEDYNRIVPLLAFQPTGLAAALFPGGVVKDPQTGTSNLLNSFDYGTAEGKEYTEELRLTSSFPGRLNFAAGAFYSENTAEPRSTNYYVESSSLTQFAIVNNFAYDATYDGFVPFVGPALATALASGKCQVKSPQCPVTAAGAPLGGLIHIGQGYPPDGSGHNYYDARFGPGSLKSYAGFGEVYYDVAPQLKITLGGRYTVDQLENTQFPIELLSTTPNNGPTFADPGFPISQYPFLAFAGFPKGLAGTPDPAIGGFPSTVCTTSLAACLIEQKVTFREFTGRANIDWTPTLSFTDKTLIYATYSRGYKGGGFNTPCQQSLGQSGGSTTACGYPLSYAPEFIDAYEVGTKNTLLGGSLQLNVTGFYYNYTGYQISRIVSESSVNENINAKIYGAEFESIYSPLRNLTFNADIGYLHSSIDNNQFSIDSLNLTQGNAALTLLKETSGANCLAPTAAVAGYIAGGFPAAGLSTQCFATLANGGPANADGTALRDGVPVNLSGHRLPNTPDWTVSLGAQYIFELPGDWTATIRGDYYWQADSFARIYNAVNDLLQSYHVVNATLTFANVTQGVDLQLFVKNAFNAQPITGTYVTDPTSGLFQNVFTLDPRTYGVQVTKRF
ncbi:MAG TPA: TonB-dependent receptor [Caulobacteraceae bacterium]